ncbi:MAG TPA: protein phosphatase 2C domain-containing protein [Terriglobia bacterium]|nr:protein phosphatase 2C domain-containing protein [Terriglobia bacterium]
MMEGAGGVAYRYRPTQSSMLDLEFAQLSDPGKVRTQNEDYLGHVIPDSPAQVRSHGWLFALADGVGGHAEGEVASRMAVESVMGGFRAAAGGDLHTTLLARLVQAANAQVFEAGLKSTQRGHAMATTIVLCALRFDRAAVAHVGDSRCYLIRRGHATTLTKDHTVANEQVRLGALSGLEAAGAPSRHMLSRSVGNEMFVSVEISDHQVEAGDVLLLCSDGFHGAVAAREIPPMITPTTDLSAAARDLVSVAKDRDGSDNVSVQLVRIRAVERVGMYRGRPYKLH